jgi:hypothetical protein
MHLTFGLGTGGGWDEFGPEREITSSDLNKLKEIDNAPALGLYKKYLGIFTDQLPASALLFPLSLKESGVSAPVVRTILSIDEESNEMTFAGNVPVGSKVRLMKTSFEKLINAAAEAAKECLTPANRSRFATPADSGFALLVSCVGRKMVLQERAYEEVAAVRAVIPAHLPIIGFYSYGEISKQADGNGTALHNQTMTIVTIQEATPTLA